MTRVRVGTMVLATMLAVALAGAALAQTTPVPAPSAPTEPAPAAPPAPAPPAPAPAPAPVPVPAQPSTGATTPNQQPPDTSISQTLDLPAHPAFTLSGKATWDEGFHTITDAFAKLNDALGKAGVTGAGKPLAVFTETDDAGFSFTAEIPLDKAPDASVALPPAIKAGETPSGKAMRFQHRGSYDEIDATYEAITAYLDEKGLEARNLFAEEYLNTVKAQDDNTLEVDIYVFLK